MNFLKQLVIPFSGLGLGDHNFQFIITDEFFEHFEYSEIENADITVNVVLDKQTSMMVLNFDINGKVDFICDRCQDSFSHKIEGNERLIIKFSEEHSELSDDLIILPLSENKINLGQHIFEYINLLFPYKRVHPDDEEGNSLCNKEMLNKLKSMEKTEQTDPRWDALKKINL